MIIQKKISLWSDKKFRWLIFSIVIVVTFEFFSLGGWHLQSIIAFPFFSAIIIGIGYKTIQHGLHALSRLNFKSINLLVVIAVLGAFYLKQYEEAAVVIVLFTLGERLEEFGIETSKSALHSLVELSPKTTFVKNKNKLLLTSEVDVGDIIIIKPADIVSMDGIVVVGSSSVDESTITGESFPKDKYVGDIVFGGTLNLQGYLEVQVTKKSIDSTLAKIIDLTFQASKTKAHTQKFIEKFSTYYTPIIMLGAVLLVILPVFFFDASFDKWFQEALTLLVIACPCALIISTPISIYSAIGNASTRGVLIKGGRFVELLGQIKVIAFDKTRTLTYGKPIVTDVIPFGKNSREHLLSCAAGIESYSEHPFAQSIVDQARKENLSLHQIKNFEAVVGKGAKADCVVCYDSHHCIGKLKFISEEHEVQEEVIAQVDALYSEGKTSIIVSSNSEIEGIIAITDELKPESSEVIRQLQMMDIKTIMLTGDNIIPSMNVAEQIGISEVRADLLPQDKAQAIKELLEKYQIVAMVGDGVNDAPSLALSSVGISMGAAGNDAAIEASSITLLNDRLELIPFLILLGRKTLSTIKFNTVAAVVTKLVFICLAVIGISNLALAIFADVGITIVVILNSLRLLTFRSKILT